MLEASVLTIDENGEPVVPYYSKDEVGSYVSTYLEKNIDKYSKSYFVETSFHGNDGEFCTDYCREVSIRLYAKINRLFTYDKTQTFLVAGKDEI